MKTLSRQIPLLVLCALVLGIGAGWSAAGPQSPPSAPVTVVNQPTNPVPVTGIVSVNRNIDPVRLYDAKPVPPGDTIARFSDFYTVPTGKRLIVEYLSCSFTVHAPDAVSCAIEEGSLFLATSSVSTPAAQGQFTIRSGDAVRAIFGPGETFRVTVKWSAGQPGEPNVFVALSGYLEDAQ